MKIALVSAMAIVTFAAPSLAAAQSTQTAPTTEVLRHADLDLTAPADAAAMLKRIRRAAMAVCSASQAGADDIGRYGECYRQSVALAVTRLNAPRVTEAYNAKVSQRLLAQLP
jgi:UrcA family protein